MKYFIGFILFLLIWISGCAFEFFVLQIEKTSYIMAYGYLVGALGFCVNQQITR